MRDSREKRDERDGLKAGLRLKLGRLKVRVQHFSLALSHL
jgi:hypothetical protein